MMGDLDNVTVPINGGYKVSTSVVVLFAILLTLVVGKVVDVMRPVPSASPEQTAEVVQRLDTLIGETKAASAVAGAKLDALIEEHDDVDVVHAAQTSIMERMAMVEEAQTRTMERFGRQLDGLCDDVRDLQPGR